MSRRSRVNPYDSKARDAKGALLRLGRLLKPDRFRIGLTVVLTVFAAAGSILAPKLLGDATNVIVDGVAGSGVDFGKLGQVLAVVAGLYTLSAVTDFAAGILIRQTVQNLGFRLRQAAQEKIDRLPLSWLDAQPHGDLLSRVTNDIDNVTQSLMQTLNQVIYSLYVLIGVLAMMVWISPLLTLLSLAVLPFGIAALVVVLGRARPQFRKQWAKTGDVSAIVEESFTGFEVVSAYGLEDDFSEVFADANDELFTAGYKGQFLSQLAQPIMGFVANIGFVIVAVAGGLQVISGRLSIGGIQAFIQYSRQLNQPVSTLASMAAMLQSGAASGERIFDFLDSPEMEADSTASLSELVPSGERRGRICFDDVVFAYEPGTPVIKGLSLNVEPGDQVAIVGPTGAGKTTLVNLLMRFYEIDSGQITVDGVSTREFSKDSLRANIGMVLQDTWLFEGTIAENIAFGKDGATREDVIAAAQATGVDRLIRQLPDGYDTVIDDEGGNISAGEKQLLTIARAYLSDPAVLILDEATSSVDTRTEMLVQRAMGELRSGRTSFVIAHRLSTIRNADVIIVMADGDVVEQGTHEELLAQRGAYYDLHQSQFTSTD
ncbi:ABC transporter ATP-binding protein [Trueperella bialowiezensis]|uniref:Fatty acid ABC transporter ATP-binding/permease protein n=1 Tax=Trueperella bialowiezensis TaxID=312285 RepID=A0A448PC39_9ACTO|nr:ABC transporter ATP-binding protein [Trueperella bialowiezensis]VEI12560.1 Probable multidrug resistance ABC transporter ATP-binding/permease protein YheH [Trueperella bialowiezensis]